MLNIKNLSTIIKGKTILDNASLSVNHGSIAVLLGESGVGKSTLLRVLNHLTPMSSGTIDLDNKPLDVTKVHTTHTVGMVFQNFNLFDHMTVERNITLALEKVLKKPDNVARHTAHVLLSKYGLAEKKHKYPPELSGGQKQRLALARTLALEPKVICLDEPTSALDPFLTTSVAQNIQELAHQQFIVLVATHDIALLEQLDCTIHLMQKGTIIETARSQQFFTDKQAYPEIDTFVSGVRA